MSCYQDKVARLMVAANRVWGGSQSAGVDMKLVPTQCVAELRAALIDVNDTPREPPTPPAKVYEFQGELYASVEAIRDKALAEAGTTHTGRLIALAAKADPDAAFAMGQEVFNGWAIREREVQS